MDDTKYFLFLKKNGSKGLHFRIFIPNFALLNKMLESLNN